MHRKRFKDNSPFTSNKKKVNGPVISIEKRSTAPSFQPKKRSTAPFAYTKRGQRTLHLKYKCKYLHKYKYSFNHNTAARGIFIFGANAVAAHILEKMISVLMVIAWGLLTAAGGYTCTYIHIFCRGRCSHVTIPVVNISSCTGSVSRPPADGSTQRSYSKVKTLGMA